MTCSVLNSGTSALTTTSAKRDTLTTQQLVREMKHFVKRYSFFRRQGGNKKMWGIGIDKNLYLELWGHDCGRAKATKHMALRCKLPTI